MFSDPITYLFLLLPIAALSGWLIGRQNRRKTSSYFGGEIPLGYIRGLNYLLNEQPDKAIDVFIQMLDVNSETVETHLALGSLFRRRGEVDRAIRIHQNLIARPTLNPEQRMHALNELGQDYMRAGLLDRAEALFSELIETGPHTVNALQQLIDIYQQEKDWEKAIDTARKLAIKTGKSQDNVIAHYYCELAEQELRANETHKALKFVKKALNSDHNCARASILEGDIEYQLGDVKAAIRAYRRVEDQDSDYIPEILEALTRCYRELHRIDEMIVYLREILGREGGISVMLALAELIREREGEAESAEFIAQQLQSRPSVRGMDRLIDLALNLIKGPGREKLEVLKNVTTQLLVSNQIYKCDVCGFSGKTLHWQCPSCKSWNTVKPIQGVEGE
ncbi:MAG: lipopolysaccharide assembly protein LapB [Gammaproteobacteria bacterium]|nr:lipopolysaccharide assembly protein LapB [Gammaproteobacteria bacterium]